MQLVEFTPPEFKCGDVVMLKSGGPLMTIRTFAVGRNRNPSIAKVDWFSDGENCSAEFFADQLVLFEQVEEDEEEEEIPETKQ